MALTPYAATSAAPVIPASTTSVDDAQREVALSAQEQQNNILTNAFQTAMRACEDAYKNQLNAIGRTHDTLTAALKENIDQLRREMAGKPAEECRQIIVVYRELNQLTKEDNFETIEKTVRQCVALRKDIKKEQFSIVDKAVQTKMQLLLQQRQFEEIMLARHAALQTLELAKRQFEEDQKRINQQLTHDLDMAAKRQAHEQELATIREKGRIEIEKARQASLDKQLEEAIKAYNKEIEVAQQILAKNKDQYELRTTPPQRVGDQIIPGRVECVAKSGGGCIVM